MSLRDRIDSGLNGDYQGLWNGFHRLNDYLFNIQKGVKTLIGGDSGTYKTTLVDYMVQSAIEDAERKGIDLEIVYNSWEIDKISKQCNWLSNRIFTKYGITISPSKIKGLGDLRLNKDEQLLVNSELEYIEMIFDKIKFNFTPTNPTGMYYQMWKLGESKGKFEYEDYQDKDGNTKQKIKKYIPYNSKAITWMITDHNYYYRKERGFETKEVMDKASEYIVELSNTLGQTFTSIHQFNDGLSAIDRQKFKGVDLSPQKSDFKDTRNFYQDSDICLGILCPKKVDLQTSLGYDVNKLGKRFLHLKVMKNRLEEDGLAIGLFVDPKSGTFRELPKPTEINYKEYEC